MQEDSASVLFDEHATTNGMRLGVATLNAPKGLNSLSLEMARRLDAQLRDWASQPEVAMVMLRSSSPRAFCAGADLVKLYRTMAESQGDTRANPYGRDFFAAEYRLDNLLHHYPKPVLCWGEGIVMGGGLGLMLASSHRVITPQSTIAFPEITIGLFPDVGGSLLLHQVPANLGLYLGLTGARLNAADTLYATLADVVLPEQHRDTLVEFLAAIAWAPEADTRHAQLTDALDGLAAEPVPPGPLQRQHEHVAALVGKPTLEQCIAAIQADDADDEWLADNRQRLAEGAPGSVRLAWALYHQATSLMLDDVFRLEYRVAQRAIAEGDLFEGIRALLIDKDGTPDWQPQSLQAADDEWASHMLSPLSGDYPPDIMVNGQA